MRVRVRVRVRVRACVHGLRSVDYRRLFRKGNVLVCHSDIVLCCLELLELSRLRDDALRYGTQRQGAAHTCTHAHTHMYMGSIKAHAV